MPELLSLLERKNLGTKNDGDFQMRVKGGASRSHLVSHSVGQTSRRQPPPAAASRRHRTLFLFSPSSSIPPPISDVSSNLSMAISIDAERFLFFNFNLKKFGQLV